ncbi:MAG TPA: cupredoxin domain-containing protein [Nitrospirota bacterium]|nr:cupredoxin domain-containing protein [Nitrospirota bacterium]
MNTVKVCAAASLAVLLFAYSSYAEETKMETKAAATPAMQEPAKTPPAEAKEAGHGHDMGPVKRFVATVGADGVQHVEITGGDYYFDPNYIVVKVNVPVELKIRKEKGYVPHDILVNAPDAGIAFKTDLKDDWQTVKFTPTKTGKYEMECDKKLLWFKSHKDRGMDGFIEVVQ